MDGHSNERSLAKSDGHLNQYRSRICDILYVRHVPYSIIIVLTISRASNFGPFTEAFSFTQDRLNWT